MIDCDHFVIVFICKYYIENKFLFMCCKKFSTSRVQLTKYNVSMISPSEQGVLLNVFVLIVK